MMSRTERTKKTDLQNKRYTVKEKQFYTIASRKNARFLHADIKTAPRRAFSAAPFLRDYFIFFAAAIPARAMQQTAATAMTEASAVEGFSGSGSAGAGSSAFTPVPTTSVNSL